MRSCRIVVTIALAGALALVVGVRPGSVAAAGLHGTTVHPFIPQTASNAAYEIQAENNYCTGGGIQCLAPLNGAPAFVCEFGGTACPGLNYADADAYGPPNGSASATPAAIFLECENFTATGYQRAELSVYSAAYESTYQYLEDDLGVIGGTGVLLDWFQQNPDFPYDYGEGNLAQVSSINATAFDPYSGYEGYGDRGTVTGTQNTNNTDGDTYNGGSVRITISGEIDTYDTSGDFQNYHFGTISCMAGGPHANDLANAGLDYPSFEGELEWDYMDV